MITFLVTVLCNVFFLQKKSLNILNKYKNVLCTTLDMEL